MKTEIEMVYTFFCSSVYIFLEHETKRHLDSLTISYFPLLSNIHVYFIVDSFSFINKQLLFLILRVIWTVGTY